MPHVTCNLWKTFTLAPLTLKVVNAPNIGRPTKTQHM